MAAQTAKSAQLTKLINRVKQGVTPDVFTREIKTGFATIPPGVDGVAKILDIALVEEKPDTKKKKADGSSAAGELTFTMTAAICTPHDVQAVDDEGKPIRGQRTKVYGLQPRKWIECYDTATKAGKVTTAESHIGLAGHEPARDNVIDSLRKLGADEATFKACGGDIQKVIDLLNKLAKDPTKGIYFRYKTTFKAPTPNPAGGMYEAGVWENWNERCDPPAVGGDDVLDETAHLPPGARPSNNGEAPTKPTAAKQSDPAPADDDPDALLAAINADGADQDTMEAAIAKLTKLAVANGKTAAEVDAAPGWDVVCEWAKGGDEDATAPADPDAPSVEDTGKYEITDPKTKKPKLIDVLVVTVDDEKRTVTLKDIDKDAVIQGANKKPLQVAWDDPKFKR